MVNSNAVVLTGLLLSLIGNTASVERRPLAEYRLDLRQHGRHLVSVSAIVPMSGRALTMSSTRPGNIAELGEKGWPLLVQNLSVRDSAGRQLPFAANGAKGWLLDGEYAGKIQLNYLINLTRIAREGWPASREGGYQDSTTTVYIGRALFIATEATDSSTVLVQVPAGWRVVAPWSSSSPTRFTVPSVKDLQDNLLAVTRLPVTDVLAHGFHLQLLGVGPWQSARQPVDEAIRKLIPQLVATVGWRGTEAYLVVQLPERETGGESFRASFAMTLEDLPSVENRPVWSWLVAHEVFHFWNGWRLKGKDYPSSQWFQEGFTEYAANLAQVKSRVISQAQFLDQLSRHVANYRQLATPLAQPCTRKGQPLYSGGALVALTWDILIRNATSDRRNFATLMRNLWRVTDGGRLEYTDEEILAALEQTSPGAWREFLANHVHRSEPLPLENVLGLAGLRLRVAGAETLVEWDPAAQPSARALGLSLMKEDDL